MQSLVKVISVDWIQGGADNDSESAEDEQSEEGEETGNGTSPK